VGAHASDNVNGFPLPDTIGISNDLKNGFSPLVVGKGLGGCRGPGARERSVAMPSRPMSLGSLRGVFAAAKPAGMNGPIRSETVRSGLEKIDRIISAIRLRFPTAAENLRHWRDGRGRDRALPASAFQTEPFLLDHLRDSHRPKLLNAAKRRLVSGELVPGRSGVDVECTDSVNPPSFTDLFFALGEFTVHSKARTAVVSAGGQLLVRFDPWRVEITADYDWDPGSWALIPGVGRVTHQEMLALQTAGYGRRYRVRSEWAATTGPEITAPATLPPGNY